MLTPKPNQCSHHLTILSNVQSIFILEGFMAGESVQFFTSLQRHEWLPKKCTQLLTPFSGTVFHYLSHGVIGFVPTVISGNHFLIGNYFQQPIINFHFKSYDTPNKMNPPFEKQCNKMVSKVLCIFVFHHLCFWKHVYFVGCSISWTLQLMHFIDNMCCRGKKDKMLQIK